MPKSETKCLTIKELRQLPPTEPETFLEHYSTVWFDNIFNWTELQNRAAEDYRKVSAAPNQKVKNNLKKMFT